MKRTSPLLFIISLILLLFLGISFILFYRYAISVHNDAATLNGLGSIRGSIQRFSKLELVNEDNDDIRIKVDSLIEHYSQERIPSFEALSKAWLELKEIAAAYSEEPNEANRQRLVKKSEESWTLSNQVVSENQRQSEHKVSSLSLPIVLLALDCLSVFLLLFIIKKYVYDSLEVSAIYDPLTKVFNRRYFMEYLNHEILRANRNTLVFSLVMFDIDRFKKVNDTYGHRIGDEVLKTVAMIAKDTRRKSDVLSRIGGEEFTILLPDTGIEQAKELAERVRKNIEGYAFPDVKSVTVSLGVTEFHEGISSDDLLQKADAAMYKAKNTGRNRVAVG